MEDDGKVHARRIIEGGCQKVVSETPLLVTVANSYHPLEYKSFRVLACPNLQRHEDQLKQFIQTVDLTLIGADIERCGLKVLPTIVAATEKLVNWVAAAKMFEGHAPDELVTGLFESSKLEDFSPHQRADFTSKTISQQEPLRRKLFEKETIEKDLLRRTYCEELFGEEHFPIRTATGSMQQNIICICMT